MLDILTIDHNGYDYSSTKLYYLAESHELIINDIIYTEVPIGFERIEDLEETFSGDYFKIMQMPKKALFLADKAFLQYKSNNDSKNSVLPDLLIGAHVAVLEIPLLTRDISCYKTYFPKIQLITQWC